jgi:bacillithiol system protein YtxJ
VNELTSEDEWEARLTESETTPFFVFKHSTTCPISASAHNRVIGYVGNAGADSPEIVMVKVIESRPVSNVIAGALGVTHQSPQMILVKNGAAVWDASHHFIQAEAIGDAVAGLLT